MSDFQEHVMVPGGLGVIPYKQYDKGRAMARPSKNITAKILQPAEYAARTN
jgi:hypothetical protein